MSRLLKTIGLFCRISSLLYGDFAKRPELGTLYSRYLYGVATISGLLKIIGLFCKRAV